MYYFVKHEKIIGGEKMILMDLKADNFYAFQNFHINMSYPKKIINSFIPNEFLNERENFRYKKVNIIMGGNATGKTSLGKLIMHIFNFIDKNNFSNLTNTIADRTKDASFSIDFVLNNFVLYKILVKISPNENSKDYSLSNIKTIIKKANISKSDNYEKCSKKLLQTEELSESQKNYELEYIRNNLNWYFTYPNDSTKLTTDTSVDDYLRILRDTLKSLDTSIVDVIRFPNVKNSFIIKTKHNDIIIQDGKLVNPDLLSSGTISGIDVAHTLYSIKKMDYEFYYCDEKFPYIHSDVEKAFLCIMINSIKDNDQLFFTTHNTDILDLPLPKHSFNFLKKEIIGNNAIINCVNASTYLKRNTDSLRNAIENDLFSTAPDLDLLRDLVSL